MSDKLRECPVCGSQARLIKASEDKRRQTNKIYCTNRPCISITRAAMHGEEDIIRIWNTRHQPAHETVEQWEERTGKSYPDDGPVWRTEVLEDSKGKYTVHHLTTWKNYKPYGSTEVIEKWLKSNQPIIATHHGKPKDITP